MNTMVARFHMKGSALKVMETVKKVSIKVFRAGVKECEESRIGVPTIR